VQKVYSALLQKEVRRKNKGLASEVPTILYSSGKKQSEERRRHHTNHYESHVPQNVIRTRNERRRLDVLIVKIVTS
jgi:hypothetical protein